MNINRSQQVMICLMVLIFVVVPSPALQQLAGLDIKAVFVVSFLLLVASLRHKRVPFEFNRLITIVLCFITALACILSGSKSQLFLGITLLSMIVLSKTVAKHFLNPQIIKYLFYFTVILVAGAWVGFFYAMFGGPPLVCIENPDARESCLYLTTFTNSSNLEYWGIIRPAGIFDEPGALSFFIIIVVCLNELYEGVKNKSLILLLLGLITMSLTHIICLIVYCAIKYKNKLGYIVLACILIAGVSKQYITDESLLYLNLLQRFTISDDGRLQGDNRSNQIEEFFTLVNSDISIFGENVMVKMHGGESQAIDQSSNPFSIWFGYGFLMWIPYVITLIVLLYHFIPRNQAVQISSILMFLLLLQRPYIYSMYWGFTIWIVISAIFLKKINSTNKLNWLVQ